MMLTLFAVIAAVVFIWLIAALSAAVWFVIELVAQNKEYEAVRERLERLVSVQGALDEIKRQLSAEIEAFEENMERKESR